MPLTEIAEVGECVSDWEKKHDDSEHLVSRNMLVNRKEMPDIPSPQPRQRLLEHNEKQQRTVEVETHPARTRDHHPRIGVHISQWRQREADVNDDVDGERDEVGGVVDQLVRGSFTATRTFPRF